MDKELENALGEVLREAWEKQQERPNQYVVAYFRTDNDERIGYHASSFCQLTQDILDAKRYSGDNPYKQLETIATNLRSYLEDEGDHIFSGICKSVQESFGGLKPEEIYMDVSYLSEGTPKQDCKYQIVKP